MGQRRVHGGGRCGVTATRRRGRPLQEPTLYGPWPGMQQQEPVLWPKQTCWNKPNDGKNFRTCEACTRRNRNCTKTKQCCNFWKNDSHKTTCKDPGNTLGDQKKCRARWQD